MDDNTLIKTGTWISIEESQILDSSSMLTLKKLLESNKILSICSVYCKSNKIHRLSFIVTNLNESMLSNLFLSLKAIVNKEKIKQIKE